MIEAIGTLPLLLCIVLVIGGAMWAKGEIHRGIGLPIIAVLGTVTVWYIGDPLYNGYGAFVETFSPATLESAWWEVALFLVVLLTLAPTVHHFLNAHYLGKRSYIQKLFRTGIDDHTLQKQLDALFSGAATVWFTLSLIAAFRLESELLYYFFPFLGHKADPWARGRLGSGLDSLLSLGAYLHIFMSASFGIVASLKRDRRIRRLAVLGCLLSWPYYILDRTRNTMLAAILPAILAWALLRLRTGWLARGGVLVGSLLVINAWFGFVIANRSSMTITTALEQRGFKFSDNTTVHHEGLNMYEELCWINSLIADAVYEPQWGQTYLSEIVSPVPRSLWPGKPSASLDYAIARGQARGIGATVSTGMIGQGVVNFGRVAGPAFAALLMSIWVAILARLDLKGKEVTLYGIGLILTFNLGRDITLLTLDAFFVGALVIWGLNRLHPGSARRRNARGKRASFVARRRVNLRAGW